MQASLGRRVILEHGPSYNVLVALGLIDQVRIANICERTYIIIVAWNTRPINLPIDPICDFPNLKSPSEDHVCKRIEATIDGEKGVFSGIVCKSTGIPDGFGVF